MAIDASIYGLQENYNWGETFGNALLRGQQIKSLRDQSQAEAEQQPVRNRLLESQAENAELVNQRTRDENEQRSVVFGALEAKRFLDRGDVTGLKSYLEQRVSSGPQSESGRVNGMNDTQELLDLVNAGATPEELSQLIDPVIDYGYKAGLITDSRPSGVREFQSLTKGLSSEDAERARRIELGLDPRAVGSSAITTATQGLTEQVAGSESVIEGAKAGAKEEGKSKVQLEWRPKIQSAIKLAEKEAEARGETLTELDRAKAAMPGLVEVSDKLKKLSDIATYTTGGKLWDAALKELGFGATKGGTARKTIVSIVDNQVLPLLKETFGAAFTAAEGDSLRQTLLDPDSTPEAKKATLDAFIEQKYRNIETKERELGETPSVNSQGWKLHTDANGNKAYVSPDGSQFEEVQ